MPGQPRWNAFLAAVNDGGGEEYLLDRIRGGVTLQALGEEFGAGRDMVLRFFMRQGDKRKDAYHEARRESAHAQADKAGEVLTEVDAYAKAGNSAAVSHAANKSKLHQWQAERASPKEFGTPKDTVNVALSFGGQFIEALRSRGRPLEIPEGESHEIGASGGSDAAPLPARVHQSAELTALPATTTDARTPDPIDQLV